MSDSGSAEGNSTEYKGFADFVSPRRRTRGRARRRLVVACCAAALAATGACTGAQPAERTARTPESAAAITNTGDVAQRPLEFGPGDPKPGVKYKHDLVTSCGLRYAQFGGGQWVSDTDVVPPAGVSGDRVSGHMTLTSKKTARFESPGMRPLTFRPVTGGGHCSINPAPDPARPPVLEQPPKAAEVGSRFWYPYGLYLHCGLRYAGFDGRDWLTIRDYEKETGIDGSGRYATIRGFARLESKNRLRFDSPGLDPIEFRPAKPGEKVPMCS
ncbi:hypothetical protein V1460_33125 [Streptomyces sp. SCSIO 30461]|uniref:hypothetical protein n=1 Tax=Streptomyces sp. SCSIO 30461 TaxID=3118085 RepID=UPI0030CDA1C3